MFENDFESQRKVQTKGKKPSLSVMRSSAIFSSLYSTKFFGSLLIHKLPNDIFLYENIPMNENNETLGLLSVHNSFKKVQELIVDTSEELVYVKLQDIKSERTDIEFLRRKLLSLGNLDAFSLAETLKRHESSLILPILNGLNPSEEKKMRKEKSYQAFISRNNELLKKCSKMPCAVRRMKSNSSTKCLEITEFGFNSKFIECISEKKSSFIQHLIRKGFPDCIHTEENYYKFMNVMISQIYLKGNSKSDESSLQCFLTSSQMPRLSVKLKFKSNMFQTDNYIELFVVAIFETEKKNLESLQRFKMEREYARMKMKNYQRKKKILMMKDSKYYEQSINFLGKFYPSVEITHSLEETLQRCKVKELQNHEI